VNAPDSVDRRIVIVRIQTPRLLLRPWRASDAPRLTEAILVDGGAHLRQWMAWARNEPQSLEAQAASLRKLRRRTLAGKDMAFGVFTQDESEVIGAVGSHARIGEGAREIGYWIRADRVRQGFAREAAGAIARIGFDVQNLRRMEIHTDPENLASIGVARSLGFQHQATVRRCILSADSPIRDDTIWSMTRGHYAGSFASSLPVQAIDRRGRRVL
jgi:RimJ/RimL family protein N-acetyltransferase